MQKKLLFIIFSVFLTTTAFAQVGQGEIKGKITDKGTGEALPFVNITVEKDGNMVTGGVTDFDGKYSIKPVPPGNYNLKISNIGYQSIEITGILVKAEKTVFQDVKLGQGAIDLKAFEKVEYVVPLFEKDNATISETMTKEDFNKLPSRSASGVASTVGGIYSKDDGSGDLNSRGSRSDANFYYIDGVKVRGSNALPKSAIEQVSVVTGGVPAQYGDVTGAIISITTRGGAREFAGSIDYLSSGYKVGDKMIGTDAYGYNLLEFSAMGPLLWKKDTAGNKTDPLVSFFIAGNASHIIDPQPSILGMWKVKDDVLTELNNDPLRFSSTGSGTFLNHGYVRLDDLEQIKTRQNVVQKGINLSGKLDFTLSETARLAVGGSYVLNNSNDDNYRSGSSRVSPAGNFFEGTLMNWNHNPQYIDNTWRVYARFTQNFGSSTDKDQANASVLKNAFYSIQFDYQQRLSKVQNQQHKDDLFKYGYIGKFETYQSRFYEVALDPTYGLARIQQTFEDTLVAFTPNNDINPEAARFTQAYYNLFGWEGFDSDGNPIYNAELAGENLRNLNNIALNGGLRNGDEVQDVYNLWSTPAFVRNRYQLVDENQFRVTASGSADIGDHAISLGFEYEQRVERQFDALDPVGLWRVGRQLTNNHLQDLDLDNPTIYFEGQIPTIDYERRNAAPDENWGGSFHGDDPQAFFDYNLRKSLGLNPDGNDYIDFDAYAPENYSIEYFSADELLNNGSGLSAWRGYDAYGNKKRNYSSDWFDRFFTDRDELGNYKREVAPYQPIYVAGYIQDKFTFDDLVFNVGVRVDRFDANQKVLQDEYVLFPTVKAGEDLSQYGIKQTEENNNIPSNIGSDYVVYVDDLTNPSNIVGFRNGNVWYNAEGTEINDASVLASATGIAPLLVDKAQTNGQDISSSSFKDYKPQVNVMPRIAFSFPISDDAVFFAHYDVLTKRPTTGQILSPVDYMFIESKSNSGISNPNLRSEQTIDYELGFKQKVNNFSSMTVTAFYRELRNLVNIVNLRQSYPISYITYSNQDFGTVKGLTFSYDLRRMGNFRGKVSYTLQFAEGTGTRANSGLNLARSGNANLKATIPLGFDQRHAVIANLDYRYRAGKDYNGPRILGKQILANTGANLVVNAGSGTPYSRQRNVTGTAFISTLGSAILDGQQNGARNPWQVSMNLGLDRDFSLTWKGKNEKDKKASVNVYAQIENLLNTKNILYVYRSTGNPDDDGFLTAPEFAGTVNGQNDVQSFMELYRLKLNDPSNYTLPRRIKIGVRLNF